MSTPLRGDGERNGSSGDDSNDSQAIARDGWDTVPVPAELAGLLTQLDAGDARDRARAQKIRAINALIHDARQRLRHHDEQEWQAAEGVRRARSATGDACAHPTIACTRDGYIVCLGCRARWRPGQYMPPVPREHADW